MIQIGETIVSQVAFEHAFCCDLSKCKGACCVEGDAGAPLLPSEVPILESIQDAIRPFLRPEGLAALEAQGVAVKDHDGEWVTPLVDGRECAYVTFDQGVAKCGIEQAAAAGAVDWPKPISCHLYPIRVTKYQDFDALNVHHWKVCEPACSLGQELKLPVFRFLQGALVRAYGPAWMEEAEEVYQFLQSRSED
ncbi:MAG: DUF3109 family protein [Bacteroidetes bacterium]|jgi:hypothetical protein|nr:DUF3109 family protein [Cryomorphaceae bacterium]MDA0364073.1 DUF3109 family protein [Bacteroidota bacterium]NCZ95154.1 DUF3109 family protein [Flavobacteriia bacterium]MDA0829168.1 DUF3109 family protein [Bacteroidota bacterium]MDA1199770.1 DUF3109 family protein [Bacteroidota bacterium]